MKIDLLSTFPVHGRIILLFHSLELDMTMGITLTNEMLLEDKRGSSREKCLEPAYSVFRLISPLNLGESPDPSLGEC